jgi:3-keto-disaccharide hydrolase
MRKVSDRYAALNAISVLPADCIAVLGARTAPSRYSRPAKGEAPGNGISRPSPWLALLVALALLVFVDTHAQTRKVDFEQYAVGQPPNGFTFGLTRKIGAPGRWVVQQEGGGKYLAQLDADRTNARFPVAVLSDIVAADVDLSVRFRPVSGCVDQAGGLVWRFQDEDNYYLVRANALENNVVLYKVQNGRRTDLPVKGEGRTHGKKTEVPSGQWSTLRVMAVGSTFTVYFNGSKIYDVEDSTLTRPGRVGMWTKADSVTQFDDLTVMAK